MSDGTDIKHGHGPYGMRKAPPEDDYDPTLHCDNKCLRAGYCMGGGCRNGKPGERYGKSPGGR